MGFAGHSHGEAVEGAISQLGPADGGASSGRSEFGRVGFGLGRELAQALRGDIDVDEAVDQCSGQADAERIGFRCEPFNVAGVGTQLPMELRLQAGSDASIVEVAREHVEIFILNSRFDLCRNPVRACGAEGDQQHRDRYQTQGNKHWHEGSWVVARAGAHRLAIPLNHARRVNQGLRFAHLTERRVEPAEWPLLHPTLSLSKS